MTDNNHSLSSHNDRRKQKSLLPIVIMGAGRLGESLITLGSFTLSGFTIVGVFDKDPKRIGVRFVTSTCGTHVVEPTIQLASRVHAHKVRRGIIAVPPSTAQEAADELIGAGVNVILSYAPADVKVPQNVIFSRIDPAMQFAKLVPSPRLPWWLLASSQSTHDADSRNLGLARLPCMWTTFTGNNTSVAINPVLLTLVASGREDDMINDADEETSTVTTTSAQEEEILDAPGFFEFIQSNQQLMVSNHKSASPVKNFVVGLDVQIDYMRETLMFRDDLVRTRGTLLYGPSGCGKSALIKLLSQTMPGAFFFFSGVEEESLVTAFTQAHKRAKNGAVTAVIVENVDVLCRKRAFRTAFLSCTDNFSFNSIFILATTNAPWDLDTSILRHFERRIQIPLPDAELRARILQNHYAGCSVADRLRWSDYAFVSKQLEGYSSSDVIAVAKNAGLSALKTGSTLCRQDLLTSARSVRPTFCREVLPLFASFSTRFGTHYSGPIETFRLGPTSSSHLSMYS